MGVTSSGCFTQSLSILNTESSRGAAYGRALTGVGQHDGPADATARAGDHGDLAFQFTGVFRHPESSIETRNRTAGTASENACLRGQPLGLQGQFVHL